MNVTKPFSRFVHTTYDAVWSIALALKSAQQLWKNESLIVGGQKRKGKRLDSFDYTKRDMARDFVDQFRRLKFQGISVSDFGAEKLLRRFLIRFFISPNLGSNFIRRQRPHRHHKVPSNPTRPTATCCTFSSRD